MYCLSDLVASWIVSGVILGPLGGSSLSFMTAYTYKLRRLLVTLCAAFFSSSSFIIEFGVSVLLLVRVRFLLFSI